MIDLNEAQILELQERFKRVVYDINRLNELMMIGGINRTCHKCTNYVIDKRQNPNEINKMYCIRWKESPPKEFVEKGCDFFDYDDIPF